MCATVLRYSRDTLRTLIGHELQRRSKCPDVLVSPLASDSLLRRSLQPFTRLLHPRRRGGSITVNRMAKYEKGQRWLPSELLVQYGSSVDSSQVISQTYKLGCRLEAVAAVVSSRRILRSCRYTHLIHHVSDRQKPHNVDPTILGSTTKQTPFARFLLGQYRTTETWLERQILGDQLLQLGGPALPALKEALGDDSRPHRHFVVTLLGRMVNEPEALGLITEVLSNPPDKWVVRGAFEALSNHLQASPQLLTDGFQKFLRAWLAGPLDDVHESASVRRAAAVSLAAMSRMPFGNGVSWLHPTSRIGRPKLFQSWREKAVAGPGGRPG